MRATPPISHPRTLQELLDAIANGNLQLAPDRIYNGLDEVARAHEDMENNRATGKLIVRINP